MHLIDSHCHLNSPLFADCVDRIIADARHNNVMKMVLPGITATDWTSLQGLCELHRGLYWAPGLHPLFLGEESDKHLERLATIVNHSKTVAIGEIGLDFYPPGVDAFIQQRLFEKQLDIALVASLPVILHVRKAHDKVLSTLRRMHFSTGGIVHAFSGSLQQAGQYYDLGFCIGVGGTITYQRATKIRKIVSELPKEALVLETDSPDMPLAGHRGENNQPQYLTEVLTTLAELRNEPEEFTAAYTTRNCEQLLNLNDL
ncbi:MAG: TatD family hydrolase [Desulfobulbaceae bacterium]|nr:TatD family hydrolase [Desulfobulbaceae bacterium]